MHECIGLPADHPADAAAPEDFHLVGTEQQTPADMLSTQTLPSKWSLLSSTEADNTHTELQGHWAEHSLFAGIFEAVSLTLVLYLLHLAGRANQL